VLERLSIIKSNPDPHFYSAGVDSILYKLKSNADFMIDARITNLENRIINLQQLNVQRNQIKKIFKAPVKDLCTTFLNLISFREFKDLFVTLMLKK